MTAAKSWFSNRNNIDAKDSPRREYPCSVTAESVGHNVIGADDELTPHLRLRLESATHQELIDIRVEDLFVVWAAVERAMFCCPKKHDVGVPHFPCDEHAEHEQQLRARWDRWRA